MPVFKTARDSGRISLTKDMVNDATGQSADVVINAAITALAAAGGGTIMLGPGNWACKAALTMPVNKFICIIGAGTGAAGNIFGTQISKATPGGFTLLSAVGTSEPNRVLCELRDLELSGNYEPGMVADFSRVSHLKLENVRFARGHSGSVGVQFREVWDSHSMNSIFENLGGGTSFPAVLFDSIVDAGATQDTNNATVHFVNSIFQGNSGTDLKLTGLPLQGPGLPTNDVRFTNTKMESGTGTHPFIDDDYSQSCVFTALSISNPSTRTGTPILKGSTGSAAGGRRGTTYVGLTINTAVSLPRFIDHQAGVLNITGCILTGTVATDVIRVGASVPAWGFNLSGYSGIRGGGVAIVSDLRQSPRVYGKGTLPAGLASVNGTATLGAENSFPYLNFDQTTEQEARFSMVVPADARPGEKVVFALNYYSNTNTGAVKWKIASTESLSADAALNGSVATATTDYVFAAHTPGQAQKVQRITIEGGVVRPGDVLGFKLVRMAADAEDTLADNARVLGVSALYEREF